MAPLKVGGATGARLPFHLIDDESLLVRELGQAAAKTCADLAQQVGGADVTARGVPARTGPPAILRSGSLRQCLTVFAIVSPEEMLPH
jgi:hypothetical protein